MIISHSLRARLRKGSRPWAFYGAEGLLTNEGHLAIIKLDNRMHWTGFGLDGKYWKLQKCENVHFWSTKKHRKCIEMATKWRWNAIYEMKHKSVEIQQNATESVGWAVCIWKDTGGFVVGRRNFLGCRIKERSALDNPRADVYNRDKERRCPCKRLAPHRHMVKKNDRHGWKRWAVISFCRYCHYRAKSAMQCQKWHARPEPTTSVNWRWGPEVRKLQQESCGIPPLLDEHREENFKKRPPMLISFQRTM